MIIGVEASRANRVQKTGVEWYAFQLIQALKKLPEAENFSWLLYGNEPLANGLQSGPRNWHETCLAWPPKYLWTQARLSWEMWRRSPDVLFVPAHVLPRVSPKRSVVTIHDIGFHHHPELYPGFNSLPGIKTSAPRRYHEWATRDIVKHAARIITVSHFSKQELIEGYGADPEKIFVTYLGVDHTTHRPLPSEQYGALLQQWQIPKSYLLFIGRLESKKNVGLIIEAFNRFKQTRGQDDPLHLVLTGLPGVGYPAIEKALSESPYSSQIRLTGYVAEAEKVALLNGATALVHPAWYEGFGLTPLEAMACGCPVLCSRVASLPEVVGEEQALWFDPQDADSLTVAMTRIMDEPETREALRARGLEWVKRYTWEATARQTLPFLTTW